jgi:hypothetical protein
MTTARSRVAAVGVVVFSLAFAWLWLWHLRYTRAAALVWDATAYFDAATATAAGRPTPWLGSGGEGSFLDVGYPYLLALWFKATGVSVVAGQALNGVLWGSICLFLFLTSRHWLSERQATIFGCLVAFAPSLSSFGPKLYSELAAIAGGTFALWAWFGFRDAAGRIGRAAYGTALSLSMAALVLTKSAFFPLLVILVVVVWVRRMPTLAVPLTLALVLVWPIQREVQRGGRGRIALDAQIRRMEIWPTSVALRCGAYSLSWNLGHKLFPEVEGACEPFQPQPGQPMVELNVKPTLDPTVYRKFTYGDQLRAIAKRPFKYALLCGVNLLGAVWIEGVYPAAVADFPEWARTVLWLFKVVLSSALWLAALSIIASSLREPRLRAISLPLVLPLVYVLLFQMNVLGEVRYFFPLLPLLYLLASLWWWRRGEGPLLQALSSR